MTIVPFLPDMRPFECYASVFKFASPLTAAMAIACLASAAARGSSSATIAPCDHDSKPCITHTEVCLPRHDEVWLVSSRCLGCPDSEPLPPNFGVEKYDFDEHTWHDSTLKEFLASQTPEAPTVVWVHGNRTEPGDAMHEGWEAYQQLVAGVSGSRPIHYVIYSWPSSPIRGLKEDARVKAARTNSDGYYLGWLVNQISPSVQVDLIGYSFGARIVTGALHLLGGGELMGRVLPEPVQHRAPMQAILIAAAVPNSWLAIGHPHGEALVAVDRMLALNNGCDRALKRYGVVDPCSRPEALGYTGAVGPLGDNGYKLQQVDLCCAVGKQHYWGNYMYSPGIVARMRPYVGLADR